MIYKLQIAVFLLGSLLQAVSAESEEADPCQGRVGIFSNPDDCTTYLICQNGISEIGSCPDGLLFDRYKRTCDRNVTVDCSDAGASDLPPYQTGVRSDDVVCESNNCSCIYPSKTICSQYYRCEDGVAYLEQCSEGLLMNPETLTCDYAEDVSCAVSEEVGQEDPCQGKVGVFSNPDDCTTYMICQNGISEIVSCPDGLLFDRYKRTCDRNASVACSDAGATDLPPYQTGVRSDDIVCESNNCSCIYPSNTSCSQYYRCEDGIAYVEQCSEGLLMNPETLTCDYAEDVTCDITPSYDTSSPTITAYYLSSGSDLEDDNEILSSTTEEEINIESKESTLYPTSEITSVIGQSTFMDGNTGNDFDENERGTTMILTSEAEFSGNTIGDDAVTPSESYSLPDSTDGMALTGIPVNGTFSQPSTAMSDNITSEDGTSTSFTQTERDLLTTVMSTVTKYFFSDKASETTSETYPATKEETSENDLETDVQSVSTSESITFTAMPYKTPVNSESTLSVSSTLSSVITGESTVTEISSAITTGESESYFDSEKTSSENGQITEHVTPESKSTSMDDISKSTIHTSPTEFIKPEDNFAQETTSSRIIDSSVKSTSPVSVVYRSTDSELSFDDTTANDNSVYTKDSSTISHDIVELSTLHINQTQKTNSDEIKDTSNLPVNFNVTTAPEETPTGTTADEGRYEIMTNVPSMEITDNSEKERVGTDAINDTVDNGFDITTNFITLTSETQDPFANSDTSVTKLTSPSKDASLIITTGSQDTSTYSDIIDSNPTSVIFTTESIISTNDSNIIDSNPSSVIFTTESIINTNDSNTETATLQSVSDIQNDITSDSASSSPTVSFTSETASELSTATEGNAQYTPNDTAKEIKENESVATNIISTNSGHIDLTTKFTEISSETPAPTTTFGTKFTALPIRSSGFSTGPEMEISTNARTEAFTSETAYENSTEDTRVSNSVSNLRTEPFSSETTPKRSTVNEVAQYTTPTEADIISSVETTGETVLDSTTKVTETTSTIQFTSPSREFSSITSETDMLTVKNPTVITSTSRSATSGIVTEPTADFDESKTETQSEISVSETMSELRTETFTSETSSESVPTITEHFIDSTTELTEATSKSQNPTSITKSTAPSRQTSTSAELETSTNTQSPKITLITKTSASNVMTPSNEVVSETRPKTLTSNSVTNFPSDSFTSKSMLESITAADIRTTFSKETTETESVDISSVPPTTKRVFDFITEFPEVTTETQNPTFIPDLTIFTERTSSIITESEKSTLRITEPTINPFTSANTGSVVVTETRTEASTPETVTETAAETFPSDTTPDLHTESFTSETSSELSRTADNIAQHTTLSRQSTETESSTVSFVSTITEQFIDSTTDFTEVTARSQDLTSVTKFTASALGSSTIVTESKANNLTTTHSNDSNTVSDVVTESLTETSSSDAVTVTQTKTVSETASETSMHETVSNLRTDPFTSETAAETSSTGKTNVTSESTVTGSVIISSLPETISLPTSVIKSTVSFPGSSTITTGSETHASTNMGTFTSTIEAATSEDATEASTESATLETMTEFQSKTSRSDLVSDLPTESLISETFPLSTTVSEDLTQYATTEDIGGTPENGSSTITSASMATEGFIDFTTELPDVISDTVNPESITKFIVPSQGISKTVTDSKTNISMITQPITITSITGSTASAVATKTLTETVTPKIVTKTQTETSTSETESDIFTNSFKTITISEINSATESISQYTTKRITGENTETESVPTSVATAAYQFINTTTEFTEMTSEKKNATSVTKFTATSQGPSSSVTDSEANPSATITSNTESITSAVVTEILPESSTPETVTEKRDETSPSERVTDFHTKSLTSETRAETENPTEDISQYTTKSDISKNETESITIISTPTTAERLVDTTTEAKNPVATKFTAPFEKTSSTTAESELDISTTEPTSFISTVSTASATVTETRSETPNLGTITVSQEETVSDLPTKSFTAISGRSTPTENITQYTTKSISTENTETETVSDSVPVTTERLIESTTELIEMTSKTEKATSVSKSTVISQGFSSTDTDSEANISMITQPVTTTYITGSTAVATESGTESSTPETVTETRGEMSPSETVTDFVTKAFTSETVTETDNPIEDITQDTTTSSISKTETITSPTTIAERLVDTTIETKKPIVTKFTVPFERTSSTSEESELDLSTTEESTSFISTGSTASATVTETRSETPNLGTITVSQEETVSDLPTKSFTAISERSTPAENITQYMTKSISTENTETETVSDSVPVTTERLTDATTELIEITSKTEKVTSLAKSTVTFKDFPTSQGFSNTDTDSEANISMITKPITITSITGSTASAVATETLTESATPETVTETRGEMSPSEMVTDFLTKGFTSEIVTEIDNSTEDITQDTTTSSISKTETETKSITTTSLATTTERLVDTTTETKKPIVTKFTAPFEKISSTTADSELDISRTEEPTSFISTESTASGTVTETRSETPNLETITVSQEETVSDLPTKSFTAISERITPTENITQYTTKSISTENTETETVSDSVPVTTERLNESTTELIEMTSKTEKATSVTKSTVTSQRVSNTVTDSEANISTITEPRIITSTSGSTSAVVTEIRTESATAESVTKTRYGTSPSETVSDLHTKPVTLETVTESNNPTEGFTQSTSSDIRKTTESITTTSAPTTTERFFDSTTETKKRTVTTFTAPFERTSGITAESEIDISTTIEPTSFIITTGSTASAIVTETRTGSAIPETVTENRIKTVSDLFTEPFTTKSISDSNTATESITRYTTKGFSTDKTETESVKISSLPTSTDRLINSTTEFTEMTSETHNPPSKFTAPSQQGSSSTATESETNMSTIIEPNIVTSTAESTTFSVVTASSTESATPGTMTETASETSAFVTMSDLHTQPSTSETTSESKYITEDVTGYTTSDVSGKSIETEPATITTAATTPERFTDSPAKFTDGTSETKNSTETFVTKFTAYETLSSSESTASEIHTSINTEPITKSSTDENSFETVTILPVETSTSETDLETRFQSSTSITLSESGTVSEVKESTTISTMCLDPNGMYPHPTDCQAFYKCTEGVPVLSLCVGDEHFNPRDHLCQDPCLALCDNTIDCSGMTQSPSVTTEEFFTSDDISTTLMTETTSYRSSTASNNEISSTSIVSEVTAIDNSTEIKISTLLTSPEKFTSFQTTLEIAKTTLSDISSTGSSEETNNSPISVLSTTATGPSNFMSTTVYDIDKTESPICQDPNGLYPDPNDCRSFIMCIGGEPYETQCDEQLHFSPLTQHCEFPCIAKCDPTLDCSSTNPPILTSAVPFNKCPQKDFFPVFEQCDYYFDCVDRFPRIQSCPVGLTFNATTRVCDWPENAECGSSVKALPESDDWHDCPCETCLVPSISSCKAYYFCFNYKAYPMECSDGLLFDQSLNTCNYQSKTLCNIASSTTTTTTHTSTTTTTAISSSTTQSYKCPERNGMFRDPSNCRRFIHCSNYWPYIKDCPGGLHFSVELQRCEWPCEAKCDLTLPCVAAQQTPTPLRLPSTTPDPLCPCKNCRVSNPESCTKYIECTNGISKRKNCPRGQTFDHQRQRCDWAHKVDCPYSQMCPRSNGLFLYKDDCHKFVHCSNGIPYIKTCPRELEFDPRTLRCEWPSGKCVSAKPEFSSRAEEIDEELFQEKWTCPEKFGYFPHETSCSKFYHCSFGTPHLKECSDDLSYNPLYQTCDWQKNVKCGSHQQHYRRRCRRYDRQILCPQNKTHVAHPHCDMFYDCSTGSPCPKRCPNGLFFNSITRMCDTAENVNCLKRDGEVYSLKSMAETCHQKGKGQMQDPANDSCFYKCHNHKVLRGCCSRNRFFDEKSNNCILKTFIPQNLRIFG